MEPGRVGNGAQPDDGCSSPRKSLSTTPRSIPRGDSSLLELSPDKKLRPTAGQVQGNYVLESQSRHRRIPTTDPRPDRLCNDQDAGFDSEEIQAIHPCSHPRADIDVPTQSQNVTQISPTGPQNLTADPEADPTEGLEGAKTIQSEDNQVSVGVGEVSAVQKHAVTSSQGEDTPS